MQKNCLFTHEPLNPVKSYTHQICISTSDSPSLLRVLPSSNHLEKRMGFNGHTYFGRTGGRRRNILPHLPPLPLLSGKEQTLHGKCVDTPMWVSDRAWQKAGQEVPLPFLAPEFPTCFRPKGTGIWGHYYYFGVILALMYTWLVSAIAWPAGPEQGLSLVRPHLSYWAQIWVSLYKDIEVL